MIVCSFRAQTDIFLFQTNYSDYEIYIDTIFKYLNIKFTRLQLGQFPIILH